MYSSGRGSGGGSRTGTVAHHTRPQSVGGSVVVGSGGSGSGMATGIVSPRRKTQKMSTVGVP